MFLGEYYLKFSGKGRVVLPSKFREEIKDRTEVILSRGLDGCIWGFDLKTWKNQAKKQLEIPVTSDTGRDIRRFMFSAAVKVELDEQGRFIIPQMLLEYSGVDKEVVAIGAGDHFEIWDPGKWQRVVLRLQEEGQNNGR